MTRFIIVILLIVNCTVIFGGVHIMASHPGQSLDIEEFFSFGWNAVAGLLCMTAAVLLISRIRRIQRGTQIILSFFLYAWRNSLYDETCLNFRGLGSSLETMTSF